MNIDRWLYKIGKIMRKYTHHVKTSDLSYHGHSMVRSRASMIATHKGLGTALLIAPPVLILIAVGVAAGSTVRAPLPLEDIPLDIPAPPASTTPAQKIVSDAKYEYPSGKNNIYREVDMQTGSELHEENSTLNAGSGGDPFQPRFGNCWN
ncbi:hypothetical protein RSAG8_05358, partial [Rhizoctonia solani AG-8 WAC10335]